MLIAEGAENVRWLLQSRLRVRSVLAKASMAETLAADLAACASQPAVLVDDRQAIDAVVGYRFTRGILACAERPVLGGVDDLITALGEGPAGLVLCDTVHDHANIGATIRNARCFGLAGAILTPGCADPFFRKTVRVSVGHVFHLPLAQATGSVAAIATLKSAGFTIYAGHRGPLSIPLRRLDAVAPRWCLVLGNEDRGPQPETLAACDRFVAIEMAPAVDSINVAAAGAVLMYALASHSSDEP